MINQSSSFHASDNRERETDSIKYWFNKFERHGLLLLFCALMALFIAYAYTKITSSVYQVTTSLILKNNNSKLIELQGIANINSLENQNLMNNEIELIKSALLIKRALNKLNLNVAYYEKSSFKRINIFHETPFSVNIDSGISIVSTDFIDINVINDRQFKLKAKNEISEEYETKIFYFGQKISMNHMSFMVMLKPDKKVVGKDFAIKFRSNQELLKQFGAFKITAAPGSTVLKISCLGENPEELTIFLNSLCYEYLAKSIEKKILISNKTLDFIESQLNEFSDSLRNSGLKLGGFKATHQIMNMDQHSEKLFQNLESLQKEKVAHMGRLRYFEYLKDYMSNDNSGKDLITPAIWGIDNSMLNRLIYNLLDQASERSELSQLTNKDNPLTKATNLKIEEIKETIIENVNSLIDVTKISIQSTEKQISDLSGEATSLPKTQLELFNYERMFKIYDVLYTYLLTKRSEIQISKASLSPENEVIDEASPTEAIIVSPNEKSNYLTALFLGIAIPLFLIFLFNYFSNTVRSVEDIEQLTHYPILGNVIHDTSKLPIAVIQAPKSMFAESFRAIKANFQFISDVHKKQIVLLTSSMMDEGKSFVALNLASSFAVSGKKTIILYFDLRKNLRNLPFDIPNDIGLSNILCGNCTTEEAIHKTSIANLSVILPGALPPNPNELIASDYTGEMLKKLNEIYDYIIIDTPPLGMFADALLLLSYSHINLFLVKYGFSKKSSLKNILATLQQKEIKNINLIINNIPAKRTNYGYGYGYQYSYYHIDKRNRWNKLWLRLKSAF